MRRVVIEIGGRARVFVDGAELQCLKSFELRIAIGEPASMHVEHLLLPDRALTREHAPEAS